MSGIMWSIFCQDSCSDPWIDKEGPFSDSVLCSATFFSALFFFRRSSPFYMLSLEAVGVRECCRRTAVKYRLESLDSVLRAFSASNACSRATTSSRPKRGLRTSGLAQSRHSCIRGIAQPRAAKAAASVAVLTGKIRVDTARCCHLPWYDTHTTCGRI